MIQPTRTSTLPTASVQAVYITKSVAIGAMLILFWFIKLAVLPSVPALRYSLIIILVLVPTLLVATRPGVVPPWMVAGTFAADIAAVTVGIHFGGGVDNTSGSLLYVLSIGLAGLIGSARAAYYCAAASAVGYGLLAWGEQRGILVHYLPYAKPADDAVATVITVTVYLFLDAWIVSYAARQIRSSYERIEESRNEAVSALSHDLKNPLGIIDGYAEMITEAGSGERTDYVRRIRQSARQALDLVHNVLDAAAVEGLEATAKREPTSLNEIAAQVADVYHASAETKGVRLTTALVSDCPLVIGDRQLLGRAVGNLVSNAIKFTDANGVVEIATAARGGWVTVSVRDSGCGIAPATQAHLFQKYSRLAAGSTVEGTGLGLYIVRRIAEAHGGSVSVLSAAGQGSTFTLSLPVAAAVSV